MNQKYEDKCMSIKSVILLTFKHAFYGAPGNFDARHMITIYRYSYIIKCTSDSCSRQIGYIDANQVLYTSVFPNRAPRSPCVL